MAGKASSGNWKTSGFARALFRGAGAIHCGLYTASGGKIAGSMQGVPVALLTTRGRKSGRLYTRPVCYVADGDGLLLVGSAGGSPRNPDWYYNLRSNADVTLQIGKQRHSMLAKPQIGSAHDIYWSRVLEQYPQFAKYQRQVARQIPVVLLSPAC